MKKLFFICLSCCFSFLFCNQSIGQTDESFGYNIQNRSGIVRVPFELHSNLIIIPVFINNSDTLRFILDTGVSSIIITDPKPLAKQSLRYTRKVQIAGAGEQAQLLEAQVAIGNTLRLDKMIATKQNLVVLEKDFLKLSEFVGIPIHGIFGYELFNNFVVTIDFRSNILLLTNPQNYKYRHSKGDKYTITIENTKPYLNMMATVDNGSEMPIRALIDTGAGHAFWIDPMTHSQIQLPEKVIKAQLGRGLNGVINGSIGRIEKIRLGKYEMQNVLTSFPDSSSFNMRTKIARQGNLGCEMLRRFVVTFNYPEGYMVLKPIRKNFKESFEHDMSGIELRAKGEKLKEYVIDKIITGSPADDSGLQAGDELLYINNAQAETMTMSEIYKIFQKGEGRQVSMLFKRDGRIQFARITLKRMI